MNYLVSSNLFEGTDSSCYCCGSSKLQTMLLSPVPDAEVAALMYSQQNDQKSLEAKKLHPVEKKEKRLENKKEEKDSTED